MIYDELSLKPLVNAKGHFTELGGSLMPLEVLQAMEEASRVFVDLRELQAAVGRRLAQLTQNEAACVTGGAAAGLTLATAACVTGAEPSRVGQFPRRWEGVKDEVVVFRCQRNGYDFAVRQAGVQLVEIGYARSTEPWELEAAIGPRTAAVIYFAGRHYARGALPLTQVVEIAHTRGVPVVVDAADQIPPISNLWRFTREDGADLTLFSGSKALRGPQSSGLVVGRPDLISSIMLHSSPNHAIGRPMKTGKEELVGLLAAVEWSLEQDEAGTRSRCEAQVESILQALDDVPAVKSRREFPLWTGQPLPCVLVGLDVAAVGFGAQTLVRRLGIGTPAVAVGITAEQDQVVVNPHTLSPGEEEIVISRMRSELMT